MVDPSLLLKTLPAIIEHTVPIAKTFVGPICDTVVRVGCKNQALLAKSIELISPDLIGHGFALAEKICQADYLINKAQCDRADLIVQAVINDEASSLEDKVKYCRQVQNDMHQNKMEASREKAIDFSIGMDSVANSAVKITAAASAAIVLSEVGKKIPEVIPKLFKEFMKKEKVKIKENNKTKRAKIRANKKKH